jgi:hypothetical protein
MGPDDGSVLANNRVSLKPTYLIEEDIDVRVVPASQVVARFPSPYIATNAGL